ncbi:hypothetical protein J1614_006599 [Plenodomus biglobosus]|nr:hypothetical protein J1614_006599 [Plenodomus biglobosus]
MVKQVVLSDSNRTPVVQILTWLTLVISVLAFLTHASIKLYIFRRLKKENWLVLCSLVLCIAQSVAVTIQCQHGFGRPMSSLSDEDVQVNLKSEYAATILFIFVVVAAIIQLMIFHQESSNAALKHDLTLGYWRSTMCNQIVQCLALLTTCLPYTKLFLEGFDTGFLGVNDLRRQGLHTPKDKSREYQLMDVSRSAPERDMDISKSCTVRTEPADSQSVN